MGAGESVLPQEHKPRNKALDLSRDVSHTSFVKHAAGELSSDGLTEFPYELRESITLYESINASFNHLTYIPEEIPLRIPHLTKLVLSYNKIDSLPETFLLFFHLKELDLDHNNLSVLPKCLTKLLTLEKLDLSHNAIQEIPTEIDAMQSLTRLNLSNNKLTTVPIQSLAMCPLKVLLLDHNKLSRPPQGVCNGGSKNILEWIRSMSTFNHSSQVNNLLEFPRVRGANILISSQNPSSVHLQYTQLQIFPDRVKTPLIAPTNSSKLQATDLKDRIVGLIYGSAIGDALAVGTEHLSADQCDFFYDDSYTYSHIIRDEHRTHWKRGDWSTQFDQLILVLDSMLHWAGVIDELEFAKRLSQWCTHGFREIGDRKGIPYSHMVEKVIANEQFLLEPHKTAESLASAENDDTALIRSLILGVPFFHNLEEVMSNSSRICRTTHADSLNVTASAVLSGIVSLILQGELDGEDPANLISQSFSHAKQYLSTDTERVQFEELLKLNISSGMRQKHNNTEKSLCLCLQTLLWLKDFRTTMLKVVMQGEDCKVTASLAGGLHGALTGYSSLPRDWVNQLPAKQTKWLNTKINHLLDLMAVP